MIVVTPNTCTDVTTWVPTLIPGAILRASQTVVSAGGKGVNVCRVLRTFGHHPLLIGLAPSDGQLIALLAQEGADFHPITHSSPGRVSQIIIEDTSQVTVVNGLGPRMTTELAKSLAQAVAEQLSSLTPGCFSPVVCCGSLPPGTPAEFYAKLIDLAHEAGQLALVDTEPRALAAALSHKPDLVSPNIAEAEGLLLGRADEVTNETSPDLPKRCMEASVGLVELGAQMAVVTGGAAGAAFAMDGRSEWFPTHRVQVNSPIGAGDAFMGGFVHALSQGSSPDTAMRIAVAVAAASVETAVAGVFDLDRATALLAEEGKELP